MALPPRPPPEPTPPLRAVLDLALRHALPPDLDARLGALDTRVRDAGDTGDWPAIYRDALAILEDFLVRHGARIDALQAQVHAGEDPNELKQRLVQGPKRDSERILAEVKAELARVAKDWNERGGRQAEQVEAQLQEDGRRSLALVETPQSDGVAIGVERAWWDQFSGHIGRSNDTWTAQYVRATDDALRRALAPLVTIALARGQAPADPPALPGPTAPCPLGEPPEPRFAEIPSFASALGASVRTHLMAATMLTSVAGGVFAVVAFAGGGNASAGSMLLRGGIIVVMLPVLLGVGVVAAMSQRTKLGAKAQLAQREAVSKLLHAAIAGATDRHRKALDRWTNDRAGQWQAAVGRWWQAVGEPRLAEAEAAANAAAKDARQQQAQLQEELGQLKMARNQLQQNLLVDLKRRLREVGG